jgi:hypothetical protein
MVGSRCRLHSQLKVDTFHGIIVVSNLSTSLPRRQDLPQYMLNTDTIENMVLESTI